MSLAARWSAIRRGRGDLPPIVSGLQFFGDLSSPSTSIVSGAVATLGDSSGNGRHFTQSTVANRPAYNASDANFGGRSSMSFNGTTQFLSNASIQWPGTTLTAFAVVRPSSTPAETRIFGARPGAVASVPLIFQGATAAIVSTYGNPAGTYTQRSALAALSIGTTTRLAVTYDIATGSTAVQAQYVNGSASGSYTITAASSGASFGTAAYGIGASDLGGLPFAGSMVDLLVYSANLTASQVAQIDAWLRWRNGL